MSPTVTPSRRSEKRLCTTAPRGGLAEEPAEHDEPQAVDHVAAREQQVEPEAHERVGEELAQRGAKRVPRLRSPVTLHAIARAIRPPSSGKAGTRLKTKQERVDRGQPAQQRERRAYAVRRASGAASSNGRCRPSRPPRPIAERDDQRASRRARRRRSGTPRPGTSVSRRHLREAAEEPQVDAGDLDARCGARRARGRARAATSETKNSSAAATATT